MDQKGMVGRGRKGRRVREGEGRTMKGKGGMEGERERRREGEVILPHHEIADPPLHQSK